MESGKLKILYNRLVAVTVAGLFTREVKSSWIAFALVRVNQLAR